MSVTQTLKNNRVMGAVALISSFSALATYIFLGLAARKLTADDFSTLSTIWSLIFVISGVWLGAIEPELTRSRTHLDNDAHHAASRISFYGIVIVAVVLIVIQFASSGLTDHGLYTNLVLPMGTLFSATWLVHMRSDLAATGKPLRFASIAPFDALVRLITFLVMAAAVNMTANSALLSVFIGMTSAAILASTYARPSRTNALSSRSSVLSSTSRIFNLALGASGLTLMLSGLPLLTRLLGRGSSYDISVVSATSTVTRAPLILVLGFESLLVAKYSLVVKNHLLTIRFVKAVVLSSAVVAFFAGGASYFIGRQLVSFLTGGRYLPNHLEISLFAVGSTFMAFIILSTPFVIAQSRHHVISRSWVAALVIFISCAQFIGDAVLGVAVGYASTGLACISLIYLDIFRSISTSERH